MNKTAATLVGAAFVGAALSGCMPVSGSVTEPPPIVQESPAAPQAPAPAPAPTQRAPKTYTYEEAATLLGYGPNGAASLQKVAVSFCGLLDTAGVRAGVPLAYEVARKQGFSMDDTTAILAIAVLLECPRHQAEIESYGK